MKPSPQKLKDGGSPLSAALAFPWGQRQRPGRKEVRVVLSTSGKVALWEPWQDLLSGDSRLGPLRWRPSEPRPLALDQESGWPRWGSLGGSSLTNF